ncbi:hypothetical protein Pd630_LPD09165 (plasmid) [Rhodococcus opacus PD630]|nr:hypothetical protein Pd630_LPD09165 [Rhodococcus opacus PD630]
MLYARSQCAPLTRRLIHDCAHVNQAEVLESGPEEVNELEMARRGAVQFR